MILRCIVIVTLLVQLVLSQRQSPCPDILRYEARKNDEEDRWYATLSISTNEDLQGIWIHVVLDRPIELLGNWFGETTSSDNQEFTIRNPKYKLEAGPPVSVRFFVKYNSATTVPSVEEVRLNGRSICGRHRPTTVSSTTVFLSYQPTTTTTRRTTTGRRRTTTTESYDNENINNNDRNPSLINSQSEYNERPTTRRTTTTNRPSHEEFWTAHPPDTELNENIPNSRPPILDAQPTCGKIDRLPVGLIFNGQNTTHGQWPWHVALYYSGGIQIMYICGGTLVSLKHVISAAHCVTVQKTKRAINLDNLIMYLGKYNLIKFGTEVQGIEPQEIKIHPDFDPQSFYNDLAIITLAKQAKITPYVRPCCLWSGNTDLNSIVDRVGTVVGWGADENRKISNNLMQAGMPVVAYDKCIFSNRDFFGQFLFDKNYCAGFRNGTSVCNGDSGGGMVFPKEGTRGDNTIWELRGLVSIGVPQQSQAICDPKHYVIFTDIAKHLSWIRRLLNND